MVNIVTMATKKNLKLSDPKSDKVYIWHKDPFGNSYSAQEHLYQIFTFADFKWMSY